MKRAEYRDANEVKLRGRVVYAPQTRSFPSGAKVSEFSMAVNDGYKKGEEWVDTTIFTKVKAVGKAADSCAHFGKGTKIEVRGKFAMDKWEDKETKKRREKLYVVAFEVDEVTFDSESTPVGGGAKPENNQDSPMQDDDIPF